MEIIEFTFAGQRVLLADLDGLPYVPLGPLCVALGIREKPQRARLTKQLTADDDSRSALRIQGELALLPLQELNFFLRTLRTRRANTEMLHWFRGGLGRFFLVQWLLLLGASAPPVSLDDVTQATRNGKPTRVSGVTPELVAQMRVMARAGMTVREIGRRLDLSHSTVTRCLNGTYPVKTLRKCLS